MARPGPFCCESGDRAFLGALFDRLCTSTTCPISLDMVGYTISSYALGYAIYKTTDLGLSLGFRAS